MKRIDQVMTSTSGRALVYLAVFIVGTALSGLFRQLIRPAIGTTVGLALTMATLLVFMLVGLFLACERRVLSRIASVCTLLILGFVALRIGHASISDAYLLLLALIVAASGALPVLHRNYTSLRRIFVYGGLTACVTLLGVLVFSLSMVALDRIALQ